MSVVGNVNLDSASTISWNSDTSLSRISAGLLGMGTGHDFRVNNSQGDSIILQADAGGVYVNSLSTGSSDWVFKTSVSGDSNDFRFLIDASGVFEWSSGSGGEDTNLYRSAANTLMTDDNFITGLDITIQGGDLLTNQTTFNLINTTATTLNLGGAATTMNIGPGGSTSTSINFAGGSGATGCTVAGNTGNFTCSGTFSGSGASLTSLNGTNISSGTVADARLSSNVMLLNNNQTVTGIKTFNNTVNIQGANSLILGSDVAFSRCTTARLCSEDVLIYPRATTTTNVFATAGSSDTFARFLIRTDGLLAWGPGGAAGQDVTLGRSAANILYTPDTLEIDGETRVLALGASNGNHVCRVAGSGALSACTSSQAYKHDIVPLSSTQHKDILDKIIGTDIFHYRWNEGDQSIRTGVIAELLPSELTPTNDQKGNPVPDWFSVYGYLWSGTRTLGIQQKGLAKNVKNLKKTDKSLKNKDKNLTTAVNQNKTKINSLINRVSSLENQIQMLQGGSGEFSSLSVQGNITTASLNVTSNTSLNNLTVSGNTQLAQITVTGNAQFGGNITVEGHIKTAGDTPEHQVLGAVTGASVQINGNDTSGTIVIETSDDTSPGEVLKMIFASHFGSTPQIVVSPSNDAAGGTQIYKSTANGEEVIFKTKDTLPKNKTLRYDYIIIE